MSWIIEKFHFSVSMKTSHNMVKECKTINQPYIYTLLNSHKGYCLQTPHPTPIHKAKIKEIKICTKTNKNKLISNFYQEIDYAYKFTMHRWADNDDDDKNKRRRQLGD